jgi:hypothetical protein
VFQFNLLCGTLLCFRRTTTLKHVGLIRQKYLHTVTIEGGTDKVAVPLVPASVTGVCQQHYLVPTGRRGVRGFQRGVPQCGWMYSATGRVTGDDVTVSINLRRSSRLVRYPRQYVTFDPYNPAQRQLRVQQTPRLDALWCHFR